MTKPEDKMLDSACQHIQLIIEKNRGDLTRNCGSPIEEILCTAICTFYLIWAGPWFLKPETMATAPSRYTLRKQEWIGGYRCDLLLIDHLFGVECVIEADGHDFHERTKEQAERDRRRDREMQSMGYLVVRFTGSEIHRDPYKCAMDIFSALQKFADSRPSGE